MGEHAKAHLWGEMNGRDMDSPEDYLDYYEDTKPAEPHFIHSEAQMLLGCFDEHMDEDSPPKRWEIVTALFPDMKPEDAQSLIKGLEALTALPEPEYEPDEITDDLGEPF